MMKTNLFHSARFGIFAGAAVLFGSLVARAYDTSWIGSGQPVSAAKLKADLDEAQTRIATLENAAPALKLSSVYQLSQDVIGTGGTISAMPKCKSAKDVVLSGGCWNTAFNAVPPAQNTGISGDGTNLGYWFCAWNNSTSGVTYRATLACYTGQ
jgi:hypothetical protein